MNPTLTPLGPGSTIGIVAPSGALRDKERFEKGVKILHELGFTTKFPRNLWDSKNYLAASDSKRAQEFNEMWKDPEVDAVMALRGGFGSLRMVESISLQTIKNIQKHLIGFSDISLVNNYLTECAQVVTVHGPVVTSLPTLDRESVIDFKNFLYSDIKNWEFKNKIEILRGEGSISGISAGGNLTTLISVIGTPFDFTWKDKIIFLEDTAEPLYKIDRMLTQLKYCGKLDEPAAYILGDFSHGLNLDRIGILRHHEGIWKRLLELTENSITVWADFPIGHGKINHSVPIGARLMLDNYNALIQYDGN